MVNVTYKKKDFNIIRLLETKNKREFLFVLVF